ncbi:hypothetical protein GGR51DRAFT_294124 [Nemania sp. FL0031]|nr:hypothetical protein GGR51DRAFT_294124 [Nemania sp. FL0031]
MTTTTATITSGSAPGIDTTRPQQIIPKTLRYRPLPVPLEEDPSSPLTILKTPDEPVPCRRCLKDSKIGDEMLLLSYDPFLGDSPYRSASPIFVHSKPACQLASFEEEGAVLPEQQQKRLLSVRAYDGKHMMQVAEVVDGNRLIEACKRMLSEETPAEYCHVHYGAQGCFAVRVEKASLDQN